MRFSENNVSGPKYYMDIYQFQGLAGGRYMVQLNFSFIIHKNEKSTRA